MAGKRDKPEEIVLKLRQVEVLQGQGNSIADAVRQIGVTQQTYYRWRKEYGGMSRDQLKRLKELETENARLRRAVSDLTLDKMILTEAAPGKLLSPSRRRQCIDHVRQALGVSERRACRTLGQHRSTQRKVPCGLPDEEQLTDDIIELAREFGRYGYRMITGMLNNSGWHVNHKRVERIWRQEGLKVPQKQPKKGRLWLNDGSCVRLRPERPNHVWSYDFVQDRTHDGRIFRTLNIIDEFTKEALVIRVKRKLNSTDVVDALTDLFILRGPPAFIRSDNGAEFIAKKVRIWIGAVGAKTAFIAPGSPWENGYCESFNARFRDELLNGEIFYSLREAQILIERWRRHYNTVRPHSALGYRPPAPESIVPIDQRPTMH
ncbi:IS3 family transposase [Ponticoccus sp. SC2-23]|nr:IS3 family transposase [Ponticoccus sp. SC6-9]MBM1227508.1 IS3 family transposase [Ponticoccus sp. SC6-15]MBM1232029.1 IS3 family transposase [Ponticoccus sp. SC6-38]MBM1236533.1 IS3 family transposase [Ponticoccus sp. SC6-45]MBM1241038.1 IS3 family transposase [Ponticoccus sp. SC6-49]MBM1245545.1 IS3 family transposase [Ponticoccus sp. SC2-64]MBM1250038.1 IS3 family transposase [Ponticoccus sp. SC6-42]MBM1254540.1 IS3 family transposase [Ponticoccus sp. SC6-33]MBM1259046.1 IS3 family tr